MEEVLRQMPAALVIVEAPSGKILFVNRQTQQWTEEYLGQSTPSELRYLGDLQDVDENGISRIRHPDGRPYEMREWPLMRSITSGEEVRDWEYLYTLADGTHLWFRAHSFPIYDDEGRIVAGVVVTHDITEQKQAEQEMETRTHQQAVVAELGLWALANKDLQALMENAAAFVAQTLDVEYCKIVELLPGGEELMLRAGVGWEEGLVGGATEDADLGSQAGYTLLSNESVILEDLGAETRFTPPPLLREHGVVSGVTVVIAGRERPFGVLGAHTQSLRTFSEDDVNFLQAVANLLAMAIERKEAQEKLEEVREAERSRIARDLHDEALQDLAHAMSQAQLAGAKLREPDLAGRLSRLQPAQLLCASYLVNSTGFRVRI
jgi:GAF domain-containing protein